MSRRELWFHRACLDGAVSALLAWDHLDATAPRAETRLRPVGYDARATWLIEPLPEGSAVVDFLFHPDAALWVDHHPTTFLTTDAEARFRAARGATWIFDAEARSCAGLFARWLEARGRGEPRFDDAVAWAERTDSADYPTPEDAVFPTSAATALSRSFAVRPDDAYSVAVVQHLRRHAGELEAVTAEADVRAAVDDARLRTERGLERLRRAPHRNDHGIFVFDVDEGDALVSRYAPYLMAPEARYSVGLVRHATDGKLTAKLTTMRNPWMDFPSVDLGGLCARFGGGGHRRVGSILLRGAETERGAEIVEAVVAGIRAAEA